MAPQKSLIIVALVLVVLGVQANAIEMDKIGRFEIENAMETLYGNEEISFGQTELLLEIIVNGLSAQNGLQEMLSDPKIKEVYANAIEYLNVCRADETGEYKTSQDYAKNMIDPMIYSERAPYSANIINYLYDCKKRRV